MNRVAEQFATLRTKRRKALIPYIMGGYPEFSTTVKLLETLTESGADCIEVGAAFSDPLADGPVIQTAGQSVLKNGGSLTKLLEALSSVVRDLPIPVVMMIYYNMIFQRGQRRFMEELKASGFSGLIVPDLPPEEAGGLRQLGDELEIGLTFLTAPTSTSQRIIITSQATTGFIYAVSLKGVTGMRNDLPPGLPEFVGRIRKQTDKPVAVGFGISKPWQAQEISKYSDGVIIGSAILETITTDPSLKKTKDFMRELRAGIDYSHH